MVALTVKMWIVTGIYLQMLCWNLSSLNLKLKVVATSWLCTTGTRELGLVAVLSPHASQALPTNLLSDLKQTVLMNLKVSRQFTEVISVLVLLTIGSRPSLRQWAFHFVLANGLNCTSIRQIDHVTLYLTNIIHIAVVCTPILNTQMTLQPTGESAYLMLSPSFDVIRAFSE